MILEKVMRTKDELTSWIRSRAETGQALNLHSVMRERPDLVELAFLGESPRGWRRSLLDAGIDPYKIVCSYEDLTECAICGLKATVLGTHLKTVHGTTGIEYIKEFGSEWELSSETFRAGKFTGTPILEMNHWEGLWSRYYVTDWILLLKETGHNLNYQNIVKANKSLAHMGLKFFGSWDEALLATGLDPHEERAIPPNRSWTKSKVIEGIRNFSKFKKDDPLRKMSNPLQMAMKRFFATPADACKAAGINPAEIIPRSIFRGEPVNRVVAAIRALEELKGSERKRALNAIYHDNKLYRRIIVGHFSSLAKLATKEGIPSRVVAPETYRDEADVLHDLDVLESEGVALNFSTLKNGHKRLYNVIRETGWGASRLKNLTPILTKFPACNPRSGLLKDRMIILRRRLRISMADAAKKAGLSLDCWSQLEKGESNPKAATIKKIEELLVEYNIPVSTQPGTQTVVKHVSAPLEFIP